MHLEKCHLLPCLLVVRKYCSWITKGFLYPHGGFFIHFTHFSMPLARQSEERGQEIPSYILPFIVKALLLAIAALLKEAFSYTESKLYQHLYLCWPRTDEITTGIRGTKKAYFDFSTCHETNQNPHSLGRKSKCELCIEYTEPNESKPQTQSSLEETSPRASHVFQCTSAFLLGWSFHSSISDTSDFPGNPQCFICTLLLDFFN